jgi:hypothetical protein
MTMVRVLRRTQQNGGFAKAHIYASAANRVLARSAPL